MPGLGTLSSYSQFCSFSTVLFRAFIHLAKNDLPSNLPWCFICTFRVFSSYYNSYEHVLFPPLIINGPLMAGSTWMFYLLSFSCRFLVQHTTGCFSYTACTHVVGPLHMLRSAEHFPLLVKWPTPHIPGLPSGITSLEEPSLLSSVSVLLVVPHARPIRTLLMLDPNSHFPGWLLRSPARHLSKDWILFISVTLESAKY